MACYKGSRCADALSYWRQLVVHDGVGEVKVRPQTYQLALKAAVAISDWEEVDAILDLMDVSAAMSGCRRRGGLMMPCGEWAGALRETCRDGKS